MGVQDLWNIIEPSCETVSIDQLRGKIIAIDLSCWAVDSQHLTAANAAQPKMYLRNLFFRACALLMQGTIPVFVLEGEPPALKKKVMTERLNLRDGKDRNPDKKDKKIHRKRFNGILRDCERMLKLMGLTCVKAEGEAEAMCAYLNEDGLVDGCLTQDGDCFLYGGQIIYRKFTLAGPTGCGRSVEKYSIEKIQRIYKIGRQKMIALALLCGCDYTPGVSGVGKVSALKFFNLYEDKEILHRMRSWRRDKSKAPTKEEEAVKSKCRLIENFPNEEVIDEFTMRRGSVPRKIESWQYPNGPKLIEFLALSLAWEIDAAFDKVLPLITRWQVVNFQSIPRELQPEIPNALIPKEIRKKKNPQSIPSFEIVWELPKDDEYLALLATEQTTTEVIKEYLTVEPQTDVRETYPELVLKFEELKSKKKTTSRKTKRITEKDINTENPGTPVKPKKTRAKKNKNQESNPGNLIHDYFQERKVIPQSKERKSTSDKLIGRTPNSRAVEENISKEPITSKLNGTLKNIYDDLCPEDFASDVDADYPEMSMIIQRTCSSTSTSSLLSKLLPGKSDRHEKIRSPSPIDLVSDEPLEISSDDDIVYIPIWDRINAKR